MQKLLNFISGKPTVVEVGDLVQGERYEVTKKLGQGGFGAVYEAKDRKTGELYALKIEFEAPKQGDPGLRLEISVLKRMQFSSHAVRYVDCGKIGGMDFLIMQLAGCNLSDLRKNCPLEKFTESTAVRVGIQCVEAIQALHSCGLLHRDIKPANFAIGKHTKDFRNVYMLDFGMVRRFRLRNGNVRPARPACGFRGTVKYASVKCHAAKDLGRVDDLWSWVYMMVEFHKGELPWRKEPSRKKVGLMKAESKATLLKDLDPVIEQIYDHYETLKYADEPNYKWIKEKLDEIMKKKKYLCSDLFDWEEHGAYHSQLQRVAPQPYESLMLSKKQCVQEKAEGEADESEHADV